MPGGIGELGSEPQLWELGSEPQLATGNWGQSRNSPISSTDERELGSEPQLADLQHGNWGQSGNFWGIGVRAATRRSPAPTKVDRRPSCRSDPNLQSPTPISASCGSDPRFRRRWIVVQVAALTPISIAALTPISPISPDPISPIAALTPIPHSPLTPISRVRGPGPLRAAGRSPSRRLRVQSRPLRGALQQPALRGLPGSEVTQPQPRSLNRAPRTG